MSSIYPEFVARFYDLIYDRVRTGVDRDYFLRKIKEAGGPVLEAGTGTGRIFLQALEDGADIYGIDISPAMVKLLQSKISEEERFRITVQDIRTFSLDQKFALIIAPFRVFMHLTDPQDHIPALNHLYHSLLPGGTLVFDLFIPDMQIIQKGLHEVVDFEGEYTPGETIRRITSSKSNIELHISFVTMRYEWTEKGQSFSESWFTRMRFFFLHELESLMEGSLFKHFYIYGNYMEEPVGPDSRDYVVVCKK
jgi:SAM-dependent methyltransferase